MHYDEGTLLGHLDGELDATKDAEVTKHLAECDECRETVARLEADRSVAADAMAALQPTGEVLSMPERRAPAAVGAAPRSAGAAPVHARHWGRWIAMAAAAAVVVGAFAFAPVRNAAADLLHIFRVSNVQTVTLTQADLEKISQALEKGTGDVDLKSFGDVKITGASMEATEVTLAQASKAVDFPIKLPAGAGTPALTVTSDQTYEFKLHVAAINKLLQAYGAEKLLPDSVDGRVFTVHVAPVLMASYGEETAAFKKAVMTGATPDGASPVFVAQTRGPELVVPDGVDAAQLRDVLVNLPFLPQNVRDQLAGVNAWQSTLLIPSVSGSAHDVTIDGKPAVVVTPENAIRDARKKVGPLPESAAVIWNDDGVVRAVGGSIDEEKAIELAKSTMR